MEGSGNNEYVRSLETAVRLLQQEVESLREQIRDGSHSPGEANNNPEAGADFNFPLELTKSASFEDLQTLLHNYLSKELHALESNIFLIKNRKISPVTESETTITLNKTINLLEEEGITDWALSQRAAAVIPNIHEVPGVASTFIIISPLIFGKDIIGFISAKTSSNLKDSGQLKTLDTYSCYMAIVVNNMLMNQEWESVSHRLAFMREKLIHASSMASLGDIARSIINETANPIQIVKANIGMIESGLGETKRRFGIINEQLEILTGINRKLLQISGESAGECLPSVITTSDVVDDVISYLFMQFQKEDIKIIKESDSRTDIFINAVKTQLEQAILSIMIYSRESMPEGGQITLYTGQTREKAALVSLTDNGMGDVTNLYSDSYFSESKKGFDFNNIRLSIARDLIEFNGGELLLISDSGRGTTYKIILPAYTGPEVREEIQESEN